MRDTRLVALLIGGATTAGFVAQMFVPRGPWALAACTLAAALALVVAAFAGGGHLKTTLAGFRFATSLVAVLALAAAAGTLILQGKPREFYLEKYGAFGGPIVALHLDDLFHSLWFGGLMSLLIAGLLISAYLRLPLKAKNAGFHACHLGILLVMAGAGLTTMLQQKGRVNLHVGRGAEDTAVMADGSVVPLGFKVTLDKFDVEKHDSQHRIAVYVPEKGEMRLKASFDPVTGEKHRLPDDASFTVLDYYPDLTVSEEGTESTIGPPALRVGPRWLMEGDRFAVGNTAVLIGGDLNNVIEVMSQSPGLRVALVNLETKTARIYDHARLVKEAPVSEIGEYVEHAQRTQKYGTRSKEPRNPAVLLEVGGERVLLPADGRSGLRFGKGNAIVFEKREEEVKAYKSAVRVDDGHVAKSAVIAVNDPLSFGGWSLYQSNYDPNDPTYSGIDVVHDPGVPFVFAGFAFLAVGILYMFYVQPKLRRA